MASAFDDPVGWLASKLQGALPLSATYTRGNHSVAIDAVIGRTVFSSNRQNAARIEFGEIDLLIMASDLILNGVAVEPATGDRIAATIRGTALTYEIMPIPGEPAWRYSDPQRTQFRVHMKRVA